MSQGFALPLKCPELPACGLSAKAAAAPPKDMLSANIRAVINNVIRLFIFSHPLSLIVLNTIGPKSDAWRGMYTLKPHPFCYLRGWGSLFRALCRDPTTFRQPGYLSCGEVHGLCAPASRRVCLSRGAGAPERTSTSILTRRRAIYMPHGHLSGARRDRCMPGSYSLHTNFRECRKGELLRTPLGRSSQNSPATHFGE